MQWEKDLEQPISQQDWNRISNLNQTFSTNTGIKANHHKILQRWYLILERFAQMFPEVSDKCSKCGLLSVLIFAYEVVLSTTTIFGKQCKRTLDRYYMFCFYDFVAM